jgi:hypothetical protein
MNRIQAGVTALVIHSELGNGKSILLEEIKCKAKEAGYAVYSFLRRGDSLSDEIEWALRSEDKTLFIVDSYPDWLDTLRLYARHANKHSALLLSARTSANDVLLPRLSDILVNASLEEISADRLTRAEIDAIVEYFDELWSLG